MEGNKSKPRALLVFGAPCSGKSTFSEKFAEKFDLAVYDFEELKVKYRLTRKNILLIIKLIARTGKTIIIEGGLGTEKEREEVRNLQDATGVMQDSMKEMSVGARKINETGEALRGIAMQMENSITEIGGQIDQFKV